MSVCYLSEPSTRSKQSLFVLLIAMFTFHLITWDVGYRSNTSSMKTYNHPDVSSRIFFMSVNFD